MKGNYFYIAAIALFLIILLGAYVFLNLDLSPYDYTVEKENVQFVSNGKDPGVFLGEMKNSRSFIVSPEFVQKGTQNSYMTSSLTLLTTVLSAKNKDLVVVARVVDDKGNLVECQSNLGDLKQNKVISIEECNQFLNDNTTARIFVDLPDETLSKPRIVVEPLSAHIYPSSFSSVAPSTFQLLSNMFPDAQQIIENVNNAVESNLK